MTTAQAILIAGAVVVMIFVPGMARLGLKAFVASVVYQIVRTLWRR